MLVNKLINGGHKNDSPEASPPDDLHQIPKFYLFDKNFYVACQHVSCTAKTNIKSENLLTIIPNFVSFWDTGYLHLHY